MSIPAVEDFTGVAAALAGPWTQMLSGVGTVTVNKNGANKGAASSAADDAFAYRNERTYSPNQFSEIRVSSGLASGTNFIQLLCRAGGVTGTSKGYEFYSDSVTGATHTEIARRVANVSTVLLSIVGTVANGDLLRMITQDIGVGKVLISVFKNGVLFASVTDSNVAAILTGAPGMGLFGTTVLCDDWQGWDLPILTTGIPLKGNDDKGFLLEDNPGFILTE